MINHCRCYRPTPPDHFIDRKEETLIEGQVIGRRNKEEGRKERTNGYERRYAQLMGEMYSTSTSTAAFIAGALTHTMCISQSV